MASLPDSAANRVLVLRQKLAVPMSTDAPPDFEDNWADALDNTPDTAPMGSRASEEMDQLLAELTREVDTEPAAPPGGDLIDARIRELEREKGWVGVMNNLGLEHRADGRLADGDTLVVMKFPDAVAHWPPASSFVRCDGSQWRSVKFRVHSDKLRHTGSSVFSGMFLPEKQARTLRRLRLTAEKLPSGITFVLDLTPPSEEDESASLLAMLSLPLSVRAWWQSRDRLGVAGELVSGHDDSCPEHKSVPVKCERKRGALRQEMAPDSGAHIVASSAILDPDDIMPDSSRDIPDYCPIRHRASILRLLESVECGSHEVDLDSAPRVFTMAKIAKYFECTRAVRDYICSWLMHSSNSQFIEMHPETALSISWDLELRDPTRVAFRIRVVEDAIELVDPRPVCAVQQLSKKTVFGRPREPLSDELETAIEHGRVKLIERVRHTADYLLSRPHDLLDFVLGPESQVVGIQWKKLMSLGKLLGCNNAGYGGHSGHATIDLSDVPLQALDTARNALEELVLAIGAYVQASVSYAMETPQLSSRTSTPDHFDFTIADLDRECYYVGRSSFKDTRFLYRQLSKYQRLLTRYPWERLKSKIGMLREFTTFSTGRISIFTRIERLNQCIKPLARHLPFGYVRVDTYGCATFFDADAFAFQLGMAVGQMADTWIGIHDLEIPLVRTSFLALGLPPDELAYLPLWAGGNNDETGGIFNEHAVPDADMGPIHPGPSYHTGCSVPSIVSSIAQSTPTASADSEASDETMTAGRSVRAAPTTRAASSVRPWNDNGSTLASTLNPASHGSMAAGRTGQTPLDGDGSETDRTEVFDFTVSDSDCDEDWAIS